MTIILIIANINLNCFTGTVTGNGSIREEEKKITTIKELAEHLNVSVSTVSRALNDRHDISVKTKKLILETADKMNYKPSNIARSLVSNKTYTIGLMVPDIVDPFFSSIAVGVEEALYNSDYQVMYTSTGRSADKEGNFFRDVQNRQLDGVIVTPSLLDTQTIERLKDLKVPAVLLRRRPPSNLNLPYVDVDHYRGACEIVNLLISKGHKKIGYLGISKESFTSNERQKGYIDTIQNYNLPFEDSFIEICGREFQDGREGIKRLYKNNSDITAVFAGNDVLAIGALEWLAINDISVPDQVSVIGFDDLEISSLHWIQLSTMAQPRNEIGIQAANLLLKMIEGAEAESIKLKTRLIERKTS